MCMVAVTPTLSLIVVDLCNGYSLLENIWTYHKLKLIEKGQSY